MFLGVREIKKNPLRYGLIGLVLILIIYLVFILTGLANGLAASNRLAIDAWHANTIVLNRDANGSLTQSNLSARQIQQLKLKVGQSTVVQLNANVTQQHSGTKLGTQVLGLNPHQSLYRNLQIATGRNFHNAHEIVVDTSLIQEHDYHLGEWISINNHSQKYQIVGTINNAKLSVEPVIYATTGAVQKLKFGATQPAAVSAVVSNHAFSNRVASTQSFSMAQFINKLPGYTAQNNTFNFMIGFLLVITLFIVAIFLYVLTIQKIPLLAVMKIQGISNGYLLKSIVSQALMLAGFGVLISGILTLGTTLIMPSGVPIQFNWVGLLVIALLIIVITALGSIVPMRTVAKVDPATVIGG